MSPTQRKKWGSPNQIPLIMALPRYFPSHAQCFTLQTVMKWFGSSVPRGMKPQLHEDQTIKPSLTLIFLFEGQLSTRMRCKKFTLGHRTAASLHIGMWPRGTSSTVTSRGHNLIKNCVLNGHSVQGTGRDARRLLSTWMENTHTGKWTCIRRNRL